MPDIDPDQSFGPPGQFINPAYATPEQSVLLRALATKNLTQQPEAKSWAGVLGGLAQTWGGLQQQQQANQVDQARFAEAARLQSGIGQQGGNGLLGGAPPNGGGGGSIADSYGPGIAKVESGGNYGAVGPKTRNGDHGYGKYQVMGKNVPGWTQEVLGQSLTPQQFLANPQAQEAVFKAKFNQYGSQTGSPQDAASMWFSGKPMAQALASGNKGDVNGMRPSAYVQAALRGGGQQMAQASPTTGMNGPQYGAIMANPSISQETKNQYQHAQTPQTFTDATGGIHAMAPGQAPAGQLTPGIVSGNISTPNATVPVVQNTQNGQPVGQGAFTQGQPLTSTVKGAAELGNVAGEIANDLDAVNKAKEGYLAANKNLGQIQSFRALGQDVDSGALPMWQTIAARFGVKFGSDAQLGRLQAYQAMAESILGGRDDGFKASIPGLSTTPEGRQYIADYLENQFRYAQELGKIAFGPGTVTQRRMKMSEVPMPQSYTSQNGPPQGQGQPPSVPANSVNPNQPQVPQRPPAGSAAAATSSAPIKITDEAGYKALPKGKQYIAPDGSLRTKK